ncbi:hypothetical protein [Kaarinaea lacus]
MPITFTVNNADKYFVSSFKGAVTDDELVNSFIEFYESEQWTPGMNELTDLSEGDASQITTKGLQKLAVVTEQIFLKHEVKYSKTAVYAPKDLAYGLSRMYEVMIDESPEHFCVFRDIDEAKKWLTDK